MVFGFTKRLDTFTIGSSGCIDVAPDFCGTNKRNTGDGGMFQENLRFISAGGNDI